MGLQCEGHRGGAVPQVQSGLGMVGINRLAIRLGMGLRTLHDLEEQRSP